MSLVGKTLEVSFAATTETETDNNICSSDDDAHLSLSPATGAESLFMAGLETSTISANALASEIRNNHRPFRSASTVATDDFHSTFGNSDDMDKFYDYGDDDDDDDYDDLIANQNKQPIHKASNNQDPKMSNSASQVNVEEIKVDAAAHVYEGAKNVWGWGKEQMVISTFLGIAEGIAGKVANVAGTDLEEIDGNLKPQLSGFDTGILNPAIKKILGIVLNAAGKGEDIFKPIVVSILKPIGLLQDSPKKESIAPELTNSRSSSRVS